jgi:hypothetical protein
VALARGWSVGSSWSLRRLGCDFRGSASLLWRILSGSLLGRAATLLRRLCLNSIVVRIFDFVFLVNGRLRNYLGSSAALFRLLDGLLDELLLDFALIFNCGGGLSRSAALLGWLDSDCSGLRGSTTLLGRLGGLLFDFALLFDGGALSGPTALLGTLSELFGGLGRPSALLGSWDRGG